MEPEFVVSPGQERGSSTAYLTNFKTCAFLNIARWIVAGVIVMLNSNQSVDSELHHTTILEKAGDAVNAKLLSKVISATGLLALLLWGPGTFGRPIDNKAEENRPVIKDEGLVSPRIAELKKQVEAGNQNEVDSFWKQVEKEGTPIVEPVSGDSRYSFVTFLWRAKPDTRNVVVFAGVAGSDLDQMTHLAGTDVWFRTYKVRSDARFTYYLLPNDSLIPFDKINHKDPRAVMKRLATLTPDPLNPHKLAGPLPASTVELPGAPPQPWITRIPGVPEGKVEEKKLSSSILKNERKIWVYTPAGYDPQGPNYDLLVLFDGMEFIRSIPVPVILDNLIAKGLIPPTVAIVLDNPTASSRDVELPCNPKFADFLAKEVVPWMRTNYHATSDPARTVVAGASYGGLASTFAGLTHSEVFGNILSQSGSYWWAPDGEPEPEWLIKRFVKSPRLPLKFFVDVGLMEVGPMPNYAPTQVAVNRHLRDVLEARGYQVTYSEFNGGHEALNWRGTLSDGLIALIGTHAHGAAAAH